MTTSQPHADRAKRLVEAHTRHTRALYGRRDAPVLQLPLSPSSAPLPVDLGLPPLYARAAFAHTRKRPRPAHPVPADPHPQGPSPRLAHSPSAAAGARPDATSGHGEAAPPRDAPLSLRAGSAGKGVPEPDPDGADGTGSSRALVTVRQSLPASKALSLTGVADALAKDRPAWHPPWKMFRGISGHLGWVRSVAVDASNEWFATGSSDRTVKIWDLASGRLKLTLTGHISAVRGIAISPRHPYMFTVGEDKTVKCWDLEQNKVIRNYHGHLSGVYCVSLHPTLDVLMTGGRDSTIRVWDIRTRAQVFVLGGHRDTVNALVTQAVDPQIISASVDSTVRMWDLAAGKCSATLTNHKKGVRALVRHPREFSFASASADNIKTWALPTGNFMRNLSGQHHDKLVNALAVNDDGVLVSGGDDGSLGFWDYSAAHCFQNLQTVVQPGSLDCEAAIYAMAFDQSGSRLITCEADKTIKMWKEDDAATPETHPLSWKPDPRRKRY